MIEVFHREKLTSNSAGILVVVLIDLLICSLSTSKSLALVILLLLFCRSNIRAENTLKGI